MAKKDAEMENMKLQMAEMVKAMKNVQHPPQSNSFASAADFALTSDTATRGRGRGRGQNPTRGGGQVGGRGRGRGSNVKPSAKDFLISSQSTRSSQSKKRSGMSPDIGKSGRGSESDEDEDADQPDPRPLMPKGMSPRCMKHKSHCWSLLKIYFCKNERDQINRLNLKKNLDGHKSEDMESCSQKFLQQCNRLMLTHV